MKDQWWNNALPTYLPTSNPYQFNTSHCTKVKRLINWLRVCVCIHPHWHLWEIRPLNKTNSLHPPPYCRKNIENVTYFVAEAAIENRLFCESRNAFGVMSRHWTQPLLSFLFPSRCRPCIISAIVIAGRKSLVSFGDCAESTISRRHTLHTEQLIIRPVKFNEL